MLRYLKYRIELRRLRKAQSRVREEYQRAYREGVQRGFDDGELSIVGQDSHELENWVQYHQTKYLESICQALIIPLPEKQNTEFYFKFIFDDDEGDRFILTTAGIHHVRGKIREEKKAPPCVNMT